MTLRVAIACATLGRVARGYETFAAATYAALARVAEAESLVVKLYGGRGSRACGGDEAWCVSSDTWLASFMAKVLRRGPYFAEQASFCASLVPRLLRDRPDVIISSDRDLLDLLWYLRRRAGFKFRLLGSNGGPMGPPFDRVDFIQHLVPSTLEQAREMVYPDERQALVPYGFETGGRYAASGSEEVRGLRARLGLLATAWVVLVAGAIEREHKRADYVIEEFVRFRRARAAEADRTYLLMLGQHTAETAGLRELAAAVIGEGAFTFRCVEASEMNDYYQAADVFALGTLQEAFGRVFVEAGLSGLGCVANDSANARYVVGEEGWYGDFTREGGLAETLARAWYASEADTSGRGDRARRVAVRFGWDRLLPEYVKMIQRCASVAPGPKHWSQAR